MYYKSKEWLEDISLDCDITAKLIARKDKRIEILHLSHILTQQENTTSQTRQSLHNARAEYEELDLDLSLIDGRLSYIKNVPEPVKKPRKPKTRITKVIANLGPAERKALISELLKMA